MDSGVMEKYLAPPPDSIGDIINVKDVSDLICYVIRSGCVLHILQTGELAVGYRLYSNHRVSRRIEYN